MSQSMPASQYALVAQPDRQGYRRLPRLLAALLAAVVFGIDTFTDIHGAIAVLYVLVLLLAAEGISRRSLLMIGVGCCLATFTAFAVAHGQDADFSAVLRCVTALAAIAITTALLLRDQASRQLLVDANVALARSERRYRSLFEQARFSLWEQNFSKLRDSLEDLRRRGVTDLAAYAADNPGFLRSCARLIETTDVNEATVELLGTGSRADTLGTIERFMTADETGLLHVLEALFRGDRKVEGRGQLLRADGRVLTVLVGINFPDEARAFDRVVVGIVDVTQREEMQEALLLAQAELARASRAATIGALSASIAHEINQPLGALVMNAQTCLRWLRRAPPDMEAAEKAAERCVRDGKRASEIVQRTRGLLVKGARRQEKVDLRRLVEEVAVLLDREIGQQSARFVTDFADEVPCVLTDPVEMQQVLINLVTNGLHAMAESKPAVREIAVRIDAPEPDKVRVTVSDRGPGISEDTLPKLFVPFFTTRSEGMGMGLAICRSIVEACGGHLTAANGPQGGAVFSFTLPAEPAEADA